MENDRHDGDGLHVGHRPVDRHARLRQRHVPADGGLGPCGQCPAAFRRRDRRGVQQPEAGGPGRRGTSAGDRPRRRRPPPGQPRDLPDRQPADSRRPAGPADAAVPPVARHRESPSGGRGPPAVALSRRQVVLRGRRPGIARRSRRTFRDARKGGPAAGRPGRAGRGHRPRAGPLAQRDTTGLRATRTGSTPAIPSTWTSGPGWWWA